VSAAELLDAALDAPAPDLFDRMLQMELPSHAGMAVVFGFGLLLLPVTVVRLVVAEGRKLARSYGL
jgi:hypothetical protein